MRGFAPGFARRPVGLTGTVTAALQSLQPKFMADFVNQQFIVDGAPSDLATAINNITVAQQYLFDGTKYALHTADTLPYEKDQNGNILGVLIQGPTTQAINFPADLQNAWWQGGSGLSKANATSIIDGQTATQFTTTNTSLYRLIRSDTFTFGSNRIQTDAIVERGNHDEFSLSVYDTTSSSSVFRVDFDFSTGLASAQAVDVGTDVVVGAALITSSGPNGGAVYRVWGSGVAANDGNTGRRDFVPMGQGGAVGLSNILHYCSATAGIQAPVAPLIAASRAADDIYSDSIGWFSKNRGALVVEALLPFGRVNIDDAERLCAVYEAGDTVGGREFFVFLNDNDNGVLAEGVDTIKPPDSEQVAITNNVPFRAGLSWNRAGSFSALGVNQAAKDFDDTLVPNEIGFGHTDHNSTYQRFYGILRKVTYYDDVLSQAQLDALTA